MFAISLVLAVIAWVAGAVLASRLKRTAPFLHEASGSPSGTQYWPFWTLALLSPHRWRQLPGDAKPVAAIAVVALVAALTLAAVVVLRFVIGGGSL